jgi:hypothetical protein
MSYEELERIDDWTRPCWDDTVAKKKKDDRYCIPARLIKKLKARAPDENNVGCMICGWIAEAHEGKPGIHEVGPWYDVNHAKRSVPQQAVIRHLELEFGKEGAGAARKIVADVLEFVNGRPPVDREIDEYLGLFMSGKFKLKEHEGGYVLV